MKQSSFVSHLLLKITSLSRKILSLPTHLSRSKHPQNGASPQPDREASSCGSQAGWFRSTSPASHESPYFSSCRTEAAHRGPASRSSIAAVMLRHRRSAVDKLTTEIYIL